ncbi:MAG: helix-turn-helix transcriptional regulator, partial [Lachnospiraceae bacterium]|nr:helix-turn-helix transcriptional regulator [Lachnospiraceae bacterium]
MSWTVRVLSENIDKHFDSHNHVGHYVISVVMQGTELPIETLAADIFVSKYYFIRKFKSSIGMTPNQRSQRPKDKHCGNVYN